MRSYAQGVTFQLSNPSCITGIETAFAYELRSLSLIYQYVHRLPFLLHNCIRTTFSMRFASNTWNNVVEQFLHQGKRVMYLLLDSWHQLSPPWPFFNHEINDLLQRWQEHDVNTKRFVRKWFWFYRWLAFYDPLGAFPPPMIPRPPKILHQLSHHPQPVGHSSFENRIINV